MFFRKTVLRTASFILSAVILISLPTSYPAEFKARAQTLEQRQAELQKKINDLTNQINNRKKDIDNKTAELKDIDSRIDYTQQLIELNDDSIAEKDKTIAQLESDIKQKEIAIAERENAMDERFQELCQRLQAISKTGNLSVLQMLMDTDSYTDYLVRSKMMERISSSSKAQMDALEAEIQAINAEKEKLAADKANVTQKRAEAEALKKQNSERKKSLEVDYAKKNSIVQSLNKEQKADTATRTLTIEEEQRVEAQIQALIIQNSSNFKYSGGTMFWPVPFTHNITSFYGMRWGKLHKGIDIAATGVYNQNIVTASTGKVIFAYTADTWGGGYGYHVIIDHGVDGQGRKISTLYAHCSQLLVSVGQTVVGGSTVIGKVGYTGDSQGAHLHFEVRVNGVAVDPIANGYIKAN